MCTFKACCNSAVHKHAARKSCDYSSTVRTRSARCVTPRFLPFLMTPRDVPPGTDRMPRVKRRALPSLET